MTYSCPICRATVEGDVAAYTDHGDRHVVDLIKYDHPEWVEASGVCPKCYAYYRAEIDGSIFKDAPCAKRLRPLKKFFRPFVKIFSGSDKAK